MVALGEGAVSYERGTPVKQLETLNRVPFSLGSGQSEGGALVESDPGDNLLFFFSSSLLALQVL